VAAFEMKSHATRRFGLYSPLSRLGSSVGCKELPTVAEESSPSSIDFHRLRVSQNYAVRVGDR